MEGQSDMAYLALLFEGKRSFIGIASPEFFKNLLVLRVHEVEIEILHAARLQLAFEKGTDVCLGMEIRIGQLIGQNKRITRVAFGKTFPDGDLTLSAQVPVRCVKIIESARKEGIDHAAHLRFVYLAVLHGQAHTAKAEVLLHVFKAIHRISPPLDEYGFAPLFYGA